jgi:hypothetical protein
MSLFGLIITPGDLTEAKAEMNAAYSTVKGLAGQASATNKISSQLASRLSSLDAEVKAVNEESSVWSLGTTLVEYTNRAKAATKICKQIAVELSAILGMSSPIAPEPSIMGTILALGVAGIAGYWIYKWATAPEPYPRRLAPQYAGGYRRGRRR